MIPNSSNAKWRSDTVFIQISHLVTSTTNTVADYYDKVWAATPGYAIASPHYFEIPQWIAEVAGRVGAGEHQYLVVVDSDPNTFDLYAHAWPQDNIYGSVMDVNLEAWKTLARRHPNLFFHLGGYVDPAEFNDFKNVSWIPDVKDLGPGKPDYFLFKGTRCIPRLQMSTGCLYRCTFCTVENKVETLDSSAIFAQVDSWAGLEFELVYLDDKTFGQAENWGKLRPLYHYIKRFNPKFQGWIVQTTAHEIIKHAEEWVTEYYVKVIECGVETLHGGCLKAWRKPHGVKHIKQAAETIRRLKAVGIDVAFVPNLIFGIEQQLYDTDVYEPTLRWVRDNLDIITFVNPYILCLYHDAKGEAAEGNTSGADADETTWEKSWLSKEDVVAASRAMDEVLALTS